MLITEMKPGQRVRLARTLHVYELGSFPAGSTGVVTDVRSTADAQAWLANVRMDEIFASLESWNNDLHVFTEDVGEVTPSAFEAVA